MSWRQLFREVLLPVYPLVELHAAGLVAVAPLASGYGVAGTLFLAAVALACWIPVAAGLGLRPAERATLKSALPGGDSPPGS